MLLLVTDTSGKHGSVGLVRAGHAEGKNEIQLVESVSLAGGTFSAQLVPQIAGLLSKHRLGKKEVDAFVVISGPGSFTGLRVGLAAIKALAEILQKPVVPVSLLEVVAVAAKVEGNVVAAVDAGRGEVYIGEYLVERETARIRSEQLIRNRDYAAATRGYAVSTPDAALAQIAHDAGLMVHLVAIGAEAIAEVGWRKLRAGQTVPPEQLEANYIRRSDAEIFSKPTSGS